jgi:hypothetical protein
MTRRVTLGWIAAVAASLLPVDLSFACACGPMVTEQERYDAADSIVVGKLSRCVSGEPDKRGYCGRGRGEAFFDVIEVLKGSKEPLPLERRRLGGVTDCDLNGTIGETYLLFVTADDHPALCSGSGPLGGEASTGPRQTLKVLREYRDEITSDLSGAWFYADDGRACSIVHPFAEAVLKFEYLYARPQPQPMLSVHLRLGMLVDTAVLLVDGSQVPLSRQTFEIHPPGPSSETFLFVRDVTRGDAAIALLESMSKPVEVVVSGTSGSNRRNDPPGAFTRPFRAATRTTLLAPAATQFKACMADHSDSAP